MKGLSLKAIIAGLLGLIAAPAVADKISFSADDRQGLLIIQSFPGPNFDLVRLLKVDPASGAIDDHPVKTQTFGWISGQKRSETGTFGAIKVEPGFYYLLEVQTSSFMNATWCLRTKSLVFQVEAGKATLIPGSTIYDLLQKGVYDSAAVPVGNRDTKQDASVAMLQNKGITNITYSSTTPIGQFRIGDNSSSIALGFLGCNRKGTLARID